MRSCKKNKQTIWHTNQFTEVEEVDEYGDFTGNTLVTPINVQETRANLYPANGDIVEQIFGREKNFDMVFVEIGKPFDENSVFYLTEPTLETVEDYDYYVSALRTSLNQSYYGLSRRV